MSGSLALKSQCRKRIQDIADEVKIGLLEGTISESEAADKLNIVSELDDRYQRVAAVLVRGYEKYEEVDKLANLQKERSDVATIVSTAQQALSDYIYETQAVIKDILDHSQHLGLDPTVINMSTRQQNMSVAERQADSLRRELMKVKEREMELEQTLASMQISQTNTSDLECTVIPGRSNINLQSAGGAAGGFCPTVTSSPGDQLVSQELYQEKLQDDDELEDDGDSQEGRRDKTVIGDDSFTKRYLSPSERESPAHDDIIEKGETSNAGTRERNYSMPQDSNYMNSDERYARRLHLQEQLQMSEGEKQPVQFRELKPSSVVTDPGEPLYPREHVTPAPRTRVLSKNPQYTADNRGYDDYRREFQQSSSVPYSGARGYDSTGNPPNYYSEGRYIPQHTYPPQDNQGYRGNEGYIGGTNDARYPTYQEAVGNQFGDPTMSGGYNHTVDTGSATSMSKYLSKIPLPTFNGNKHQFESWWQTFSVCIDNYSAPAEIKFLRLKQCLVGEAEAAVDKLGFSAAAYEIAKERLHRKYGGERRRLALRMDEIDNLKPVRDGNAGDLERLSEALDRLVVNLLDQGQGGELGRGTLYLTVRKKLNEDLLRRYERWLSENRLLGDVLQLRKFITAEAEFHMIASETVSGITKNFGKQKDVKGKAKDGSRTLATDAKKNPNAKGKDKAQKKYTCKLCQRDHGIWKCSTFTNLSVPQRKEKVRELKLCLKCLSSMHTTERCYRRKTCFESGCVDQQHHTLLHEGSQTSSTPANTATPRPPPNPPQPASREASQVVNGNEQSTERAEAGTETKSMFAHSEAAPKLTRIAFRTVPIFLINGTKKLKVNAFIDEGSNQSFISERASNELGLQGHYESMNVNVIDDHVTKVRSKMVSCILMDVNESLSFMLRAKTLRSISPGMEVVNWSDLALQYTHLEGLKFLEPADGPVEVMLGLDSLDIIVGYTDVLGKPGEPAARLTPLGWTCVGTVHGGETPCTYYTSVAQPSDNMQDLLRRFWEIEEPEKRQVFTKDEKKAVDLVKESILYKNGRYCVGLPWKEKRPEKLNNYVSALNRLKSTERKLLKSQKLADDVQAAIDTEIEKKYTRLKKGLHPAELLGWILPQFPIVREGVETTKTRLVNDGSAPHHGICLNDLLLTGPKLQQSLLKVLTRFRRYRYAALCDVQEMYKQILVEELDCPYQCFIWRNLDQSKVPEVYEYTRVVFGLNCSPFLAQYVARYNAERCKEDYPRGAEVVLESTYMDDSQDSEQTEESCIQMVREVNAVWDKAAMRARKWLSNSERVMEEIPIGDRAKEVDLTKHDLPAGSSLGQGWRAKQDKLFFKSAPIETHIPQTKRSFLKVLATVFDPAGLASPITIRGRMVLQELWLRGLEWDDSLPVDLQKKVADWVTDVSRLKTVELPRCLLPYGESVEIYLVTFTDASDDAYGAIVYVWSRDDTDEIYINIAVSKARVTPLQTISTPRKELMGAVVGANLAAEMGDILKIPMERRRFYSDSMDVLFWVRGHAREYKPFVDHRIGEIQSLSIPELWQHVSTKENPADLLSRGCTTQDLTENSLWWKGAPFLQKDPASWPARSFEKTHDPPEKRKKAIGLVRAMMVKAMKTENLSWDFAGTRLEPRRFSSLVKYVRVTAYVIRFVLGCLRQNHPVTLVFAEEFQDTLDKLLRMSQEKSYKDEIRAIRRGSKLEGKSPLDGLDPWLDEVGLLRAVTRLSKSVDVSWVTKFPIILDKKCPVTFLLVRMIHEKLHHSSTNLVYCNLRAQYLISGARELIRSVELSCARCVKAKARPVQPQMAPLPPGRVDGAGQLFAHTSLDFAGPYYTKQGRYRARTKRYMCLFTCLHSRAIHLEMVYDMTTQAFLMCLTRMTNRRGKPKLILSDQGSNLVGGCTELREFGVVLEKDKDEIAGSTADKGIRWDFNPPGSPHFSGVHEIMVKAAKKAVGAVIENEVLTDEELQTVFSTAEDLVNSRPLTYQSTHTDDFTPLTPNQFITGRMDTGLDPGKDLPSADNLKYRWRLVQDITDRIWSRWMQEWIIELGPRKKWKRSIGEIKVDDVVLLLDPDLPRKKWNMGRVTAVYPGEDGVVRVADVKFKDTTLRRPAVKLCPMKFI